MSQRALVIGAGGIGVASAWYLSHSGWEVTVIDSGDVCHGCSYGNACLITPSHSHPLPGPGVIGQSLRWMLQKDSPFYIQPRLDMGLLRWGLQFRRFCNTRSVHLGHKALMSLTRESLQLFLELQDQLDFFFEQNGLLQIYLTDRTFAEASYEQEILENESFSSRLLSKEETLNLEPALSTRIAGGLFIEGEAHAYSYGYVMSMARELEQRGVTFLTRRPVSRILATQNRVRGAILESPNETVQAEVVVLAAGSWTPQLAMPLGVNIPLQPAKGYSATIDAYAEGPRIPLMMPENKVIVTPLGNRLRFGGTLELAGFNRKLNRARYDTVVRKACSILRHPPELKNEEPWFGFRPITPDGLPIIDRTQNIDGLIIATGHGMLGFSQSAITGKLVSELANEEIPSVSLEPFQLNRF